MRIINYLKMQIVSRTIRFGRGKQMKINKTEGLNAKRSGLSQGEAPSKKPSRCLR